MKKKKVLNLYAGIGGNRKEWGNDYDITAVELDTSIATVYRSYFPNDKIIITDAHEYLLNHFKEFDFIWSSPPCQSHSRLNAASFPKGSKKYVYPDMQLYQQILFLKQWFKGKFVVENVIPYYQPLITDYQKIGRHLFWSNFNIGNYMIKKPKKSHQKSDRIYLEKFLNYDLSNFEMKDKRQCLRNCVLPELGKFIINRAFEIKMQEEIRTGELFIR